MRVPYIALAVLLALGAATPGLAADSPPPLSYNLRLTGSLYSGIHPQGAIAGTLGGIAVDGTYGGGAWSLSAYGRPFAAGTYECLHICTFAGTTLAGRPTSYTWTSQVPTWDAQTQVASGQMAGVFSTREAWAARVAAWARAGGLPAALQTRLIFDARTGM